MHLGRRLSYDIGNFLNHLTSTFRIFHGSSCNTSAWPCLRPYTQAAIHAQAPKKLQRDDLDQLEKDSHRILTVVRRRIQERTKLLSLINLEFPSPEDVQRAKQIKELEPIQLAWNDWQRARQSLQDTIVLLDDVDPTMRSLAAEEYESLIATILHHLNTIFPYLLTPKSTTSHLSALLELRSGVGGSEASLFLSDVLRMYVRFSNMKSWTAKIIAKDELDNGGLKGAILEVVGDSAYDTLRWESGVHRVQRVPATEAAGRVHTSTVSVIVLPLSIDSNPSSDTDRLYEEKDIKIEVMRARGAGGQHVNKTESAVRLTHLPTGITVSMQDERSQHMNKARAFQVLRARLLDRRLTVDMAERRAKRLDLVKSADRSEKIRTYNYAQDRVTDHRISLTMMNLSSVMEGVGLADFIHALKKNYDETVMENLLDDPDV